jgi:hypothetical protein
MYHTRGNEKYTQILKVKLHGKGPLENLSIADNNNIRLNMRELVCDDVNWIELA